MTYLTQLRSNKDKYRPQFAQYRQECEDQGPHYEQLASLCNPVLSNFATIMENKRGGPLLLVHKNSVGEDIEEVILKVQGFIVDTSLPPIRQFHIPRNHNRIIDMKQSATLTGLGSEEFLSAVQGVAAVYQQFKTHIIREGGSVRDWSPGLDGKDATLTFSTRYLTKGKDAGDETPIPLGKVVDPFNVLSPLLRTEVHLEENTVEYWEKFNMTFTPIRPELIALSNFVELQVAFVAVRLSRAEYIFLPKLRGICVLSREVEKDYNAEAIRTLTIKSKPVSPLKKVKRRVGYGGANEVEEIAPENELKRMHISNDTHKSISDVDMN